MTVDDDIAGAPTLFREFLKQRGLVYDPATQIDLLACALGSQFLLFAGPSGTGKSTAAKALADFLTPRHRWTTVDARPAWTSSEDVVGQYSAYSQEFLEGPATEGLLGLRSGSGTPILLIEEANLSPMEAYAGPVITTASSVTFSELSWPMHHQAAPVGLTVPQAVVLSPWPRVFGTVNVDSTAEAPAPKVSGRACVVLLEPPTIDDALGSTDALNPPSSGATGTPPGARLLGNPQNGWASHAISGTSRFTDALRPLMECLAASAGRGSNLVSPRDVQRCMLYMAWHAPLAEAAAAGIAVSVSDTESAENSVLHFVLPGLSSEQFGRAVDPLLTIATPGGLLAQRLKKLTTGGESLFGVSPDFWASLS